MRIKLGSSICGCTPTKEEKERVLMNLKKDLCVHCGNAMIPAVVEITCFCRTSSADDPDPWGGRVIDVEKCRVLYVDGQYKYIHEICMHVALPFLNS